MWAQGDFVQYWPGHVQQDVPIDIAMERLPRYMEKLRRKGKTVQPAGPGEHLGYNPETGQYGILRPYNTGKVPEPSKGEFWRKDRNGVERAAVYKRRWKRGEYLDPAFGFLAYKDDGELWLAQYVGQKYKSLDELQR